jgi:hypothetical protein
MSADRAAVIAFCETEAANCEDCVRRHMQPAAVLRQRSEMFRQIVAALGAAPWQPTPLLATIDGRCHCGRCKGRTEDIYRMVGHCHNCGAKPFLLLFRAGDPARPLDCPTCGKWYGVHTDRLATPDEIPAAALPAAPEPQP